MQWRRHLYHRLVLLDLLEAPARRAPPAASELLDNKVLLAVLVLPVKEELPALKALRAAQVSWDRRVQLAQLVPPDLKEPRARPE